MEGHEWERGVYAMCARQASAVYRLLLRCLPKLRLESLLLRQPRRLPALPLQRRVGGVELGGGGLRMRLGLHRPRRRRVLRLPRRDVQGGDRIGELHELWGRQVLGIDGGVVVERLHRLPSEWQLARWERRCIGLCVQCVQCWSISIEQQQLRMFVVPGQLQLARR